MQSRLATMKCLLTGYGKQGFSTPLPESPPPPYTLAPVVRTSTFGSITTTVCPNQRAVFLLFTGPSCALLRYLFPRAIAASATGTVCAVSYEYIEIFIERPENL